MRCDGGDEARCGGGDAAGAMRRGAARSVVELRTMGGAVESPRQRSRGGPRRKGALTVDGASGGVVLGIGAMCAGPTATQPVVDDRPDARAVGVPLLGSELAERLAEELLEGGNGG